MLRRASGPAALAVALVALVAAVAGTAIAQRGKGGGKGKVVRLDANGKIPRSLLPKVSRAVDADRVGGATGNFLRDKCAGTSVDLGSWCLQANTFPLPPEDIGKNNYFIATQLCESVGGYLPTAAQLIGAADRVKLAGSITDSPLTASIDEDPTDGLRDRREMSGTLITTQAGSSAAGSQGVSEGSKGDPKSGEPDPVPFPANPSPETLQYVTVYDNENQGGFAGSKPVGQPENFRCAFNKRQGSLPNEE